jgi:centromere protein J
MSIIQCPIQTCHKTIKNIPKKLKINYSINEEKKNILENHKEDFKQNNVENKSLLNIYKKEKEMKNKLQQIFINNKNLSENNFFSGDNEYNNQFYNFDSNSKYLSKAKEFLLDDLSEEDKNIIREIDNQILSIKKQISDINEEKNKYNKMMEEKRNELIKFESERNKEEFEYERELINDMRSVINKFKMEIYKKEIGLTKEDNQNENNQNEVENEEIKNLKDEYKELKSELNTINKNNEKFIVDIQKKIMILKYENEQMKEKIESYQEKENFERLDNDMISSDNLLLLNQNLKKNKIFEFDDEEQNITINKDFSLNNIVKTSSKLNHLKELDFEFPEKYFDENDENNKIIKHQFDLDGKTIKIYKNNKKEIIFPNNTRKQIFPDGYTLVYFSNGDIKEIIPNNKEIYYYKKDEVYQVDFIDGGKCIKYLKTGKIFCDGNPIN